MYKLICIALASLLSCSAVLAQETAPSKSSAQPAGLNELELKNLSQLNEVCEKNIETFRIHWNTIFALSGGDSDFSQDSCEGIMEKLKNPSSTLTPVYKNIPNIAILQKYCSNEETRTFIDRLLTVMDASGLNSCRSLKRAEYTMEKLCQKETGNNATVFAFGLRMSIAKALESNREVNLRPLTDRFKDIDPFSISEEIDSTTCFWKIMGMWDYNLSDR